MCSALPDLTARSIFRKSNRKTWLQAADFLQSVMKNGLPKNGNWIGGPMGIPAATQQEQYLELSCNLAELKKIKECIFQIACKSNQEIDKKIYLACEEIFVNIVSYSGADHARFFCSRNADKITVIFTDNGRLFNPLESRPEKDFNDFVKVGWGSCL